MDLIDAIQLIRYKSLEQTGPAIWADLGAGSGLFTFALANILPTGSIIHSMDKMAGILISRPNPKNIIIKQKRIDFIREALNLYHLDGILMANSLHFVEDKIALIYTLQKSLKDISSFIIVEYDTDTPNAWVPFPVSFLSLKQLFQKAGYRNIEKIHERQSVFGRTAIYAAFISN